MIAASPRARRSSRDQAHDRTDRQTAPEESVVADAAADVTAAPTQPRVTRFYAGRRRRPLHAAALRRMRDILLSGAGCVPGVRFRRCRLLGRAAARHALERNLAACPGRRALPRACAMARRAGCDGM